MNRHMEQLKAKRAKVHDQIKGMVDASIKADEAEFSEEDQVIYDAAIQERQSLDGLMARLQDTLDAELTAVPDPAASLPGGLEIPANANIVVGDPNILEDPFYGFGSFGGFAASVASSMTPGNARHETLGILAAATGGSQGSGPDGGFLVPPTFAQTIWDGLNEGTENLLGQTDNFTVTGESLTFNANAETDRATGSRYGGIRGYWIAEADQITSSLPRFRQVKLEPQELAVLVYETDKVLRNAVALEQHLTRAAVDEINFLVGDSIINGTGTGQPLGILTSGSLVTVAKENLQEAATVVSKNIFKMYKRMHPRSIANAVWYINQQVWTELFDLSIDVGTGGSAVFVPPGGLSVSPFGTLLGRPVQPIEYCSALGTVGDIIFADLGGGYTTGTQGSIRNDMSIHLRFDFAETVFRFMFAVDGQPWLASELTPFKGTANTLSTHVALATRS